MELPLCYVPAQIRKHKNASQRPGKGSREALAYEVFPASPIITAVGPSARIAVDRNARHDVVVVQREIHDKIRFHVIKVEVQVRGFVDLVVE